jgi:hypothetical protein
MQNYQSTQAKRNYVLATAAGVLTDGFGQKFQVKIEPDTSMFAFPKKEICAVRRTSTFPL